MMTIWIVVAPSTIILLLWVLVLVLLLYDHLLSQCYMPHGSLPNGNQEELYASMADAQETLALGIYAGSWRRPIQDAHLGKAIGVFGDAMHDTALSRLLGPGWIYDRCQPITARS